MRQHQSPICETQLIPSALLHAILRTPVLPRHRVKAPRRTTVLEPSHHIEGLLESLVRSINIVPAEARAVTDRSDLSLPLQRIINKGTNVGMSWKCWTDKDLHVWLFVGGMLLGLSRQMGSPVLQVRQYRERGLPDTANWVIDRQANWRRCDAHDAEA